MRAMARGTRKRWRSAGERRLADQWAAGEAVSVVVSRHIRVRRRGARAQGLVTRRIPASFSPARTAPEDAAGDWRSAGRERCQGPWGYK